jgi:uracil phosphoribosyltransferase
MKEIILNHPMIKHKISVLRSKETSTKEFRELISEISMILCYEAFKNEKLTEYEVETPIAKTTGYKIDENNYAFVPILRAGMGMIDGVLRVMPTAKIGHIGLYRNEETHEPVKYFSKFPKGIEKKEVILLDPMLATGGSGSAAITLLKQDGVKKIKFLSIIAAPEGIARIKKDHPDVQIYAAQLDDHLNENGYIVPGLGDAGDRIYGTK